ncbi:MAG: ATP-binding protein [Thaumarchaeota archaeon]|nr:ATP-binding protein [Nitrososphaerota archaeon]|tara:strand:+ start:2863 stop:3555 length:693 start_codon:yes stop_codon:yes gene_type:complete
MNLAALYSGGKDSTFSLYKSLKEGHHVLCLIAMLPDRDDSIFFHYPNAYYTLYQAECLDIPLISKKSRCESKEQELDELEDVFREVKQMFAIDGIVTGGLASKFQQENFTKICNKLDLQYYSPNWNVDQTQYMDNLLANNFIIMIVGVSASGLNEKLLGRIIDPSTLNELKSLSEKHGFSIAFEGGEAETFVLDCPLFKKRIEVKDGEKHWDGIRGYFEILGIEIINKQI